MRASALCVGTFMCLMSVAYVQGLRPNIYDVSVLNDRFLKETFPVGGVLGIIGAEDPEGSTLSFFLRGAGGEYFAIDQTKGVVTLKKELDFETDPEIKSKIVVVDSDGEIRDAEVKVFVNDENDNEPVFDNTGIFAQIDEDESVGFVVSDINVKDRDTKNQEITVTCNGSTPLFAQACQKFRLVQGTPSNKFWTGRLVLAEKIDFEDRISYAILLTAFDGKYYVNNEVHVEVIDVNDTPPRFIEAGPSIIDEEEPLYTVFQTIKAVDQDTAQARDIVYELIDENLDKFTIGETNGSLAIATRLDYDSDTFPKDVPFELTIKAREVQPDGTYGNDPLSTATIQIKVTVKDINDNTPTFNERIYRASVDENIVSGANIPGLQMTITDIDSGTFNSFELVTLDHQDVFQIIPREDASSASATLFVVDGRKIDFETGPRQYTVQVEARQNKVPNPQRTGTATVIIDVKDVNDITPSFQDVSYVRSVSERARGGELIINLNATDPEAGAFGEAGIKYRLYGNIPAHFTIDENSGVIQVAACATPGEDPCIDYERKKSYTLTVSATDNNGADDGRTRSVQLIVNVLDENDVRPAIEETYVRYIQENSMVTINPLRIDASDPDTEAVNGRLSYAIRGDSTNLWKITTQIDPSTQKLYGNITAVRPILFEDAPDQENGMFKFAVVVEDNAFQTTANIIIYVLDINNNAPVFTPRSFVESIPENFPGEKFVIQVTATDGDAPTTGNGQLDISIGSGDRGKFYAKTTTRQPGTDNFVADIYTTQEATFNFEAENVYTMELLVRDRGTPQSKMGSGTLTVNILDINNRNPIIRPSFESITISENTSPGISIHRVSATDADDDRDLRFSFEAASATDGNGVQVNFNNYDYRNLFRMDSLTGEVYVNSSLDRDRAASVTFDLLVRDVAANPVQSGTGLLLIHITEYNDQPPQFNTTHYYISIKEELNINSFIQNLYCTDEDDKIQSYSLTQDEPRRPTFFSFYSTSGAMLVENRIDYDRPGLIEKIELTAFCVDSGSPPLSASAKVTVTVTNINDNYPTFKQPLYRTSIPEGSGGGVLNVNVEATDQDRGDYGVVRYSLVNTNGPYDRFFSINAVSGQITILNDAVFDREETGFFGIQVQASDSPNDPRVRLQNTVPVYITIEDINDHCPVFSQPLGYSGKVPESAEPDTSIIDIMAIDKDDGPNARLVYSFKAGSGNPPAAENLFNVGQNNGRVLVKSLLRGQARTYSFILVATDMEGNNMTGKACATEVPVTVEVQESLNNAPKWERPPRRDFVIYVLESQYEGMLVYSSKAVDENRGPNGVVDYYFMDRDQLTHKTADFRINRVTGVIRAEVVFDREERDTYFLTLLAKDRGNPAASSETTLTIVILDVDDNDPMFPMKDGAVEVLNLPEPGIQVRDGAAPPGQDGYLGQCQATDDDSDHENNRIFYEILAAQQEVRNYIRVDRETCRIYLTRAVDFDAHPVFEFDILAYNEKNDDTVQRYRKKRAVNPSIQHVIVAIKDVNDNAPVFTSPEYFGCVSYDAPYNKTILVASATDVDAGDNTRIRYSLAAGSQGQGFAIDSVVGTLFNTMSFRDARRSYQLNLLATDQVNNPATAKAMVFVTSPSNMVRLKLNRPLSDVQPFSQQLVNSLTRSGTSEVVYACIDKMRNHINSDGDEVLTATDVLFTSVRRRGGAYEIIPAGELVGIIKEDLAGGNAPYDASFVSDIQVDGDDDGFTLEEDAVLVILILAILLVVLALFLFCVACYCIRKKDKKKKKKIREMRHSVRPVQEPQETSFNPVYDNTAFVADPEYSTVKKVKPTSTPIAPVVIPAPQNLEPLASEFQPQNLQPVEPEDPVPVIETEVLPVESPVVSAVEPPREFQPEYEDRIETEVMDVPLESAALPPPPPPEDNPIEVVIEDVVEPALLPAPSSEPIVTVIETLEDSPVGQTE